MIGLFLWGNQRANQRMRKRKIPKNAFKPGNPGGPGGPRPGSGRPPNEFREWLRDLVHSKEARSRLLKILNDTDNAEEKVTDQGVCVPTRTKANTYLQALELAWNYAEGKPKESLEVKSIEPDFARLSPDDLFAIKRIIEGRDQEED